MRQWSGEEVATLREFAHMGAEACSKAIQYRCHRYRSAGSCQRQASRLHISMAIRNVCPECGFTSTKRGDFDSSGLCKACNLRHLSKVKRAEAELIRSCDAGTRRHEFERAVEQYSHEYDMHRQQKHRLREEVGEEAYEKFKKVSNGLSNGRSEAQSNQQKLF